MIYHGDCIAILATLPEASIDACVTDPPYGIGFMGREWDTFKPGDIERRIALHDRKTTKAQNQATGRGVTSPSASASMVAGKDYDYSAAGLRRFQEWTEQWAREVFRVLKPGAHIVVCGAPRAYHRMASGLEDAGFEIRDCLAWLFGSGFPKSLNLGDGRGTALKPAHEPIVLARKPFKGSVSANVEKHGTGALNIDACRIGDPDNKQAPASRSYKPGGFEPGASGWEVQPFERDGLGRWPANVCLDEEAAAVLDEMSGILHAPITSGQGTHFSAGNLAAAKGSSQSSSYEESGGASRFYYVAKPSREERDLGCYDLPAFTGGEATDRKDGSAGLNNPRAGAGRTGGGRNFHPTVKPIALMRWLVRLVTPPGGTVLDPFMGSGTTGCACVLELREFIGIERETDYLEIARRRIGSVAPLFTDEASA